VLRGTWRQVWEREVPLVVVRGRARQAQAKALFELWKGNQVLVAQRKFLQI
jgi:hypothetical protein